jgi:hypothetical protein
LSTAFSVDALASVSSAFASFRPVSIYQTSVRAAAMVSAARVVTPET